MCYCDTYCQKTRDCCEDYEDVCQISGELLLLSCPQKLLWKFVHFLTRAPIVWAPVCVLSREDVVQGSKPEMAGIEVTWRQ